MPLTFLAHQAPVLPLKARWPHAWDGTALVIGSMAPDLSFVAHPTPWYVEGHSLAAQFLFCLPLTVALTWFVKRHLAGVLAPHLPGSGGFDLRGYQRLAGWPARGGLRPWVVVALSALIGSLSHLALDAFTHADGLVVRMVPLLQDRLVVVDPVIGRYVYVHDLLQVGLSAAGIVISLVYLRRIGRQRRMHEGPGDHAGTPLATRRSRRILVWWTTAGAIAGLVTAMRVIDVSRVHDAVFQLAGFTFAGVVVGCFHARRHLATPVVSAPADIAAAA